MKCCILSCTSYSDKRSDAMEGITFHSFPSDELLREQWLSVINREDWVPTKHSRICSNHFQSHEIVMTKNGLKKIDRTAIPSLNLNLTNKSKYPEVTIYTPQVQQPSTSFTIPTLQVPQPSTSVQISTPQVPQPPTSAVAGYLIFDGSAKMKKLEQELRHLRWKDRKNGLKARNLQLKVSRMKKKVQYLTHLVKELENKILLIAEDSQNVSSILLQNVKK